MDSKCIGKNELFFPISQDQLKKSKYSVHKYLMFIVCLQSSDVSCSLSSDQLNALYSFEVKHLHSLSHKTITKLIMALGNMLLRLADLSNQSLSQKLLLSAMTYKVVIY